MFIFDQTGKKYKKKGQAFFKNLILSYEIADYEGENKIILKWHFIF